MLGPSLFALMVGLGPPGDLSPEAWRVAALTLLMATWWVSEALPLPVTALLPVVVLPLMGVSSVESAAAPYANPLIFLFLGGFLLAMAIQRWNLHRRIAITILSLAGRRPDLLIGGFMVATAGLSMWVSNTATAAMMLPIGLSVIALLEDRGGGSSGISSSACSSVSLLPRTSAVWAPLLGRRPMRCWPGSWPIARAW